MTVLVTGASGHIAASLIRLLLSEGFAVRALVRKTSNISAIALPDVQVFTGDIQDESAVKQAMHGCEAVFHLAAPTRVVHDLSETVLSGTETVLRTAAASGVGTIVYTSSIVTVGYSKSRDVVLDETSKFRSHASAYHIAKCQAEQLALEWASKRIFNLVIVNPSTVVGGLDLRVTPSNEPIQRALTGGLPFTFDSGLTIAPVRDVARGHLLALRNGRSGERYILGGERLAIPEYFRLIEECCGIRSRQFHLPRGMLLGAGAGLSLWHAISGKQVPFTFTQARNLVGNYGFYSSEKARTELGYSWRPASQAIKDYVDWVRSGRPVGQDWA